MFNLIVSALLSFAPSDAVVIILDDVGYTERSHLTSLDRIAACGVEFTRAYAEPVCSSARFASLAGAYPRRADLGDVVNAFNSLTGPSPAPDRTWLMLPEVLLSSHDTALIGKWHLGRLSIAPRKDLLALSESGPFGSGFESWRSGSPNSIAQPPNTKDGYYDWYRVQDNNVIRHESIYATDAQVDDFVAYWAETAGTGVPRFVWLALSAPHQPYDPPPGYSDTGNERQNYLNVLDYADMRLHAVLDVIDLATTYVVYWADNGTPDSARIETSPSGYWKGTTYEGGIRVPFAVAGPLVKPGVSSRLVSCMDIPATISELTGHQALRGFPDSHSFADELGSEWNGEPERTWLMAERYDVPCNSGTCPQPEGYDDTAYVEGPTFWPGTSITVQLKRRVFDADGIGPNGFEDLIYNLLTDPYELNGGDFASFPQQIRDRFTSYENALPPRP